MTQGFDAEIGVLGAGPAGARAATVLAAEGADVLVWDGRAPWEKPCGGGLAASAFEHVPELREVHPWARRIDAVRFQVAPGRGFSVPLARPMYMISRKELGRWQLDRLEAAGARRVRATVRSIQRTQEGWRVEGREGREWRVRLLVGSDGAASLVRRVAAPGFRVELAPTRVSYPSGAGDTPETILVRLYHEVEGYFWDFARPDHRSVGVGTEPGSWSRARMDREIDGYAAKASGSGASPSTPRRGAVIGTAAWGHGDFSAVGGRDFALLGDAAGFADPATGEGIQNALRSGGILADAYREGGDFSSYSERARTAFAPEFRAGRLLRRVLFGAGVGAWLVRRGERSPWARSLVSAVMNCTNEHDLTVAGLLRRSLTGGGAGTARIAPGPRSSQAPGR